MPATDLPVHKTVSRSSESQSVKSKPARQRSVSRELSAPFVDPNCAPKSISSVSGPPAAVGTTAVGNSVDHDSARPLQGLRHADLIEESECPADQRSGEPFVDPSSFALRSSLDSPPRPSGTKRTQVAGSAAAVGTTATDTDNSSDQGSASQSENSISPATASPTDAEFGARVNLEASILANAYFPMRMVAALGLDDRVGCWGVRTYLARFRLECGATADPLERQMIDQLAFSNLLIADLQARGHSTTNAETAKVYLEAAIKLRAEHAKTVLTLQMYRAAAREGEQAGTNSAARRSTTKVAKKRKKS